MVDIQVKPQVSGNICAVMLIIIHRCSIATSNQLQCPWYHFHFSSYQVCDMVLTSSCNVLFWAAYSFWQLDQLNSAVAPPHCVVRETISKGFSCLFVCLSTE